LSVELLENSKKWYQHYSTLNQVESCEFLKETFRYTLPQEFVKKINFVNLFMDRLNGLKRERQFDKIRELCDSIVPQKHVCGEEFFYVDKYMIDGKLNNNPIIKTDELLLDKVFDKNLGD